MSTVAEDIVAALQADSTVTGLVSTRIYPNVMPQGATFPAIVYSVISVAPESTLDGSVSTRMSGTRFQLDCYSRRYLEAHQVAAAVDDVVGNLAERDLSAWKDNERDIYDNETQTHRVLLEFIVWRQ